MITSTTVEFESPAGKVTVSVLRSVDTSQRIWFDVNLMGPERGAYVRLNPVQMAELADVLHNFVQ